MTDMYGLARGIDASDLLAAAVAVLAVAFVVIAYGLLRHAGRLARAERTLESALQGRDGQARAGAPAQTARAGQDLFETVVALGSRWKSGRLGQSLLAEEDLRLIDQCGFEDQNLARNMFAFCRVVLGCGLPLLAWLLVVDWHLFGNGLLNLVAPPFVAFALGWMVPKWFLQRRSKQRCRTAQEELPLFIDLLRLLQGSGLSIDQCLHVIAHDFRHVMPVLSYELRLSIERYSRGMPREQSLARIATGFGNEDLVAVTRLIVQVERHGGAVQEPLRAFSERIREQRRLGFKARVGKLTVKMTGIMVLTLLPSLLIITGGAGFLAVIRSLSRMTG